MTPEEALADALQWLKDCDGSMAMANNPMSAQLIKAGLAREGAIDHLGRKTLLLVEQESKKEIPPGIPYTTYTWFRKDPIPDADENTVNNHIMEVWRATNSAREKVSFESPDDPEKLVLNAFCAEGFLLFSTREARRFEAYAEDLYDLQAHSWELESRVRHSGLGIMGVLSSSSHRYVCLRVPTIPDGCVLYADAQVQETLLVRYN